MTFHSHIDYACRDCRLPYIPFDQSRTCPLCINDPVETFPIVDEVQHALRYHGYQLPIYMTISLGDLYIVNASQALMAMPIGADVDQFSRDFVRSGLQPEAEFWEDHLTRFLIEVLKVIGPERDRAFAAVQARN